MFTKIRRFAFIFVLAFACVLFIGCKGNGGETPEPTPTPTPTPVVLPAPTSLEIEVDFAPLDQDEEIKATSIGGDDICLVAVVPDGCNPNVVWTSRNEDIATVDENGFVTPVKEGLATIVASSAVAPGVMDEITIRVHPANIAQLLLEAIDYVKTNVKYLDGNAKTRLPQAFKSDIISYKYFTYETKEEYRNNVFTATAAWRKAQVDAKDMMRCTVTYIPKGISMETSFDIFIVKNVESNDFTTVAAAHEAIDALFANENLDAYEKLEKSLEIVKDANVAVQWSSSNEKILKVSKTAGDGTDDKTDDVFKVEYIRPIDNTAVELTATILSPGTYGETAKYNITARGYTKAEKVGYFQDVICANMPAADAQVRKDVLLPTYDQQFGMIITWESDKPELLNAQGVYTDDETKESSVATKVTLTAHLVYLTADETGDGSSENPFTNPNSFVEDVKFELNVYPCTDAARAANKVAAYTKAHIADGNGWFPWGKIDRASNQLTGLPATLGEAGITGDWANVALTWSCSEEGLFDAEWNLLKQYLRYHQVILSATAVMGSDTEVIEVPLNVGIAQKEKTSHIGGSFSRLAPQANDSVMLSMDSLQTLSAFDGLVGTREKWYKDRVGKEVYEIIMSANEDLTKNVIVQPGADDDPSYVNAAGEKTVTMKMQFGIGVNCGFGGITMYWDDPDTGIRFQFYSCEAMTWVIGPDDVDENGELIDADGDGKILSMLDRDHQNWEHIILVNMSGKDVKIPVSYSKDYDPADNPTRQVTYTPYKDKIFGRDKDTGFSSESIGEVSITFFAGKPISIINNGVVGCIEAESKWNEYLDGTLTNGITDDSGTTEYAQYLTLPNGAIGWSANSGQDPKYEKASGSVTHSAKEYVSKMLSTAGNEIHVEFWNIHPCNTFTTNDEWQLPEGYTSQLNGVRVRDDLTTDVYYWARTLDQETYHVNQAWVDAAAAELPAAPKYADLTLDFMDGTVGSAYANSSWVQEKYTSQWDVVTGQMNCREKDGVRVVNFTSGYSMTHRYTYTLAEEAVGIANKLAFKAGNYFSPNQEIPVKIVLIDKEGNSHYILGDANNFAPFAATSGLVDQLLEFDDVEVAQIRIVCKGAASASQYLYVGALHLYHE